MKSCQHLQLAIREIPYSNTGRYLELRKSVHRFSNLFTKRKDLLIFRELSAGLGRVGSCLCYKGCTGPRPRNKNTKTSHRNHSPTLMAEGHEDGPSPAFLESSGDGMTGFHRAAPLRFRLMDTNQPTRLEQKGLEVDRYWLTKKPHQPPPVASGVTSFLNWEPCCHSDFCCWP